MARFEWRRNKLNSPLCNVSSKSPAHWPVSFTCWQGPTIWQRWRPSRLTAAAAGGSQGGPGVWAMRPVWWSSHCSPCFFATPCHRSTLFQGGANDSSEPRSSSSACGPSGAVCILRPQRTFTARFCTIILHVQAGPRWIRRMGHSHASFCLGVLHGVAGSSHFLGVIPALALPTRIASVTYIAAFGAGTVAAMTIFAAVVFRAAGHARRRHDAHRMLLTATALLAIIVGGILLLPPGLPGHIRNRTSDFCARCRSGVVCVTGIRPRTQ